MWLSSQSPGARATLRQPLTVSPIKNVAYFLEALSVYCDAPVGADESLKVLAALRAGHIKLTYSTATVSSIGVNCVAAASRAASLVFAVARTCTYANYGDQYVAAVLALSVPPWRTAAIPCGAPVYAPLAAEFPATANDRVRPLLEQALKTVVAAADLTQAAPAAIEAVLSAIATIRELCDGQPAVHVNCGLSAANATVPAIAVFSDDADVPWSGVFIAYQGKYLQPQNAATAVSIIVNWLLVCRASGATLSRPVRDLAAFVLDNEPSALSARIRRK